MHRAKNVPLPPSYTFHLTQRSAGDDTLENVPLSHNGDGQLKKARPVRILRLGNRLQHSSTAAGVSRAQNPQSEYLRILRY